MSDLEWSEEPPEEAGWYWTDSGPDWHDGFTLSARLVLVVNGATRHGEPLVVKDPDYDWPNDMLVSQYEGVRWAGPIPEPNEPA